jgi:hypothetical protein
MLQAAEPVAARPLAGPALAAPPVRRPALALGLARPAARSALPPVLLASRDGTAALPAVPSPDATAAALPAGLGGPGGPGGPAQARAQLPWAPRRHRRR